MKVLQQDHDCFINEEIDNTVFEPEGLQHGETYYWTVIPNDGINEGICVDGIFRFRVNYPPVLYSPGNREMTYGNLLIVRVSGYDQDASDAGPLVFLLKSGPEGMTISENDSTVRWRTMEEDIGDHKVTVVCSDGLAETEISFTVTVKDIEDDGEGRKAPGEEVENGILIFLLAVVFVSVLMFVVMIFYMHSGKTEEYDYEMDEDDS